jgi:hypothetical protein
MITLFIKKIKGKDNYLFNVENQENGDVDAEEKIISNSVFKMKLVALKKARKKLVKIGKFRGPKVEDKIVTIQELSTSIIEDVRRQPELLSKFRKKIEDLCPLAIPVLPETKNHKSKDVIYKNLGVKICIVIAAMIISVRSSFITNSEISKTKSN